ncbi:hypothetical protein AAVH_19493, partial [Aphelenchoides avenae]
MSFHLYIIASSSGSLICELLVGLCHPIPYYVFPYAIIVGGGIIPLLDPSQLFSRIYTELCFISCCLLFYCNAAMFLFRLAQSVDSPKVKLLSNPKYGFGIAAAAMAATSTIIILLFNRLWTSDDKIRASIRSENPALYAAIKDKSLVGFEIDLNAFSVLLLVLMGAFVGLCGAGMVISAVGCQYFIRSSQRPWLSERTLQLYRKLANMLVLDLGLFGVTMVLPGVCAAVTFLISPANT